ncbi:MAG TPA: FAD binding domain-containing protein [Gaiellales bacterium]|nr:FAD binding domain-containing protein [Gaiellales bacterium]
MTVYTTATSLDQALDALAAGARAVAGGTDLVVAARQGKTPLPDSLVGLHRLPGLGEIELAGDRIRIGALVSHDRLAAEPIVREQLTALADASAIVGSHATRNAGTLGGNLMNASPAMDTGGPLICLGAVAELRSRSRSREVPVEHLFAGPGRTVAESGELLVGVHLPVPAPATGSCYVRLEYRRQMEIAVVGVTAAVTLEGGAVTAARVAITALAPTIRRVEAAEAALLAGDGAAAVAAAAAAVAAGSAPISDVRAGAGYRRAMAEVIARRAIGGAIVRARGGSVQIPASDATYGATEEPRS